MIQNLSQLIGAHLGGQYEIISLLAEGGMGAVYTAHDRELDGFVVVKVLKPGIEATMGERFEREIQVAMRLHHDHIVQTLGHGRDSERGIRFVAMEWLKGRTLQDLLRGQPGERLNVVQSAQIADQVADALNYAHSKEHELVHRDIKPANIFLADDPRGRTRVKVMDFGIARSAFADEKGRGRRKKYTQIGEVLGTYQYMPPEQWMGEPVFKSDVYALGIVMYLMVEGRFPFPNDIKLEGLFLWHHEGAPAPMRVCTSPAYRRLVLSMLAKDPRSRPSPSEVQDRLEEIFAQEGHPGLAVGLTPLPRPSPTPQRDAPSVIIAGPEEATRRHGVEPAAPDDATVHELLDGDLISGNRSAVPEDTGGVPMAIIPVEKTRLSPRASAPTRISRGPNAPTRITIQPVPTPPKRRRWWPWGRRT